MKGQTKEIMEIVILVIGVSVLLTMSYFFLTINAPQTGSLLVEQQQYERVTDAIKNLFYSRIPVIEKTYAQLLGDMIENDGYEMVDYGYDYGSVNVTDAIYSYFKSNFEERWHFRIFNGEDYNFGYDVPLNKRIRTFRMRLPIPSFSGEVVKIEFKQW